VREGIPGEIVCQEIMVKADWLHEDVAAAGVPGFEGGDFLRGGLYGPESPFRIEDPEMPEIVEVTGELLKDDHHGMLLGSGQDAACAPCPAGVKRARLKRCGHGRPRRCGFSHGQRP